jgi:hypothetical protein
MRGFGPDDRVPLRVPSGSSARPLQGTHGKPAKREQKLFMVGMMPKHFKIVAKNPA